MRYCPNCNKPYSEEAFNCPDCGYSPESEHEAEATAKMPAPGFLKKNALWLALGAAAIVIAIIGGIIIYMLVRSDDPAATTSPTTTATTKTTDTGVRAYQDNLTKSWNTLRDITVELVKKDAEVVDQASLNSFNALLTVSYDKIEQVRNEMGGMQVPSDFKKRHDDLIDAIGSYRDYLKSLMNVTSVDPSKVVAADFEPVNTAGADAQKKVVAIEKQLAFLRALPDECFILHTTLNPFYTAIWQKPQPQAPRTPAPAPTPAPAASEQDAILAMVLGDSAGSWAGADNYEVVSYDPTTSSAIVLVTYYLPNTITYTELYCDKDQYGWYVSYENTYEVPY